MQVSTPLRYICDSINPVHRKMHIIIPSTTCLAQSTASRKVIHC
jgi:hypothetical protein